MTTERWQQVRSIFEEALEYPLEDRACYLDQACREDAALRGEVEQLLANLIDSSNFLESPPVRISELLPGINAGFVFAPGDLVAGRFQIVKPLARGGMGEVYEAEDTALSGLRVALKTVRGHMLSDDHVRRCFEREVELARQVTHPNVCRMYDIDLHRLDAGPGDAVDLVVLSMELLQGETLADRLHREAPLAPHEVASVARQMISALAAAHDVGVVHGDLKPNNVMLVRDRDARLRAVVSDFGLAHRLAGIGADPVLAGAPAYVAPEQLASQQETTATDIYALGVVLYELMAGVHPFPEIRTFEDALKVDRRRVVKFKAPPLRDGIAWEPVIRRCLQAEPKDRYASAIELRDSLAGAGGMTRRKWMMFGAGAVGTMACAAALFTVGDATWSRKSTVAVLPFENTGGDPDDRYFVAGITDEIRQTLSHVPGLRMIATLSSAEVGRAGLSFVTSGTKLGASHLVAGSVARSEGRVRVTVRLVDANNGLELWTRTINRPERDASTVRLEIASAIAPLLQLRLSTTKAAELAKGMTKNSQALDLYWRAREAASSRAVADMARAVVLLGEALQLDPQFAAAWAARAEAQEMLAGRAGYPLIDWMAKAQRDAFRALDLHPELPEALLEMALIRQRFDWDWTGAEEYFSRAITANPNLTEGHRLYAGFLSNMGRADAALAEVGIALELDPLSIHVHNLRGAILYRARRYKESLEQFENVLRMNPNFENVYTLIGDAYGQLGMWTQAIERHRDAVARFNQQPRFLYNLAFALAMSGQTTEAEQLAESLEVRFRTEGFHPWYLAKVYLGLGRNDLMFDRLETAWQQRDPNLLLLKVDPWMDRFRGDPRYQDLVRRMRL